MNLFDIIGPVMIGPSSSHTAGAVRMGNVSRKIFAKKPDKVAITLYNSFSKTGKGHGTDKALVAGILGYMPDDSRIINAFDEAKKQQVDFSIVHGGEQLQYHENTAKIIMQSGEDTLVIIGKSIGGGRIVITRINEYETEYTGEYNALITIHLDIPGVVSKVTGYLAQENVNIAFMRLCRAMKGSRVLMIIEADQPIPQNILKTLKKCSYVEKSMILNQI